MKEAYFRFISRPPRRRVLASHPGTNMSFWGLEQQVLFRGSFFAKTEACEKQNGHGRLVAGDTSALRGTPGSRLRSTQVYMLAYVSPHEGRHSLPTAACLLVER